MRFDRRLQIQHIARAATFDRPGHAPPRARSALLMLMLALGPVGLPTLAASETVAVTPPPAPEEVANPIDQLYASSHALVIGIDRYTAGWPSLTNAVRDAELVAVALKAKGFEVDLHVNLDSNQLAKVFKRFIVQKGQDKNARLFIWYAGHGATLDGEGYLVPGDSPLPKDSVEFKLNALALRDFGTYMRQAVAKHVYAVFDSCFAGTVFASQRSAPSSSIVLASTLPVRQFLTSGDAFQEVSDDGTFRELFLRAINGEERADSNADGFLTGTELGMFIGDRLTNLTQSQQTPKHGKLRDKDFDRGDFVFVLPGGAAQLATGAPVVAAAVSTEVTFWDSIKSSKSVAQFDLYLSRFPDGSFVDLAQVKKKELIALQRKSKPKKRRVKPKPLPPRPVLTMTRWDEELSMGDRTLVRNWPDARARAIARLESGERVWAIASTQVKGTTWYRVARDGVALGFVPADALVATHDRSINELLVGPDARDARGAGIGVKDMPSSPQRPQRPPPDGSGTGSILEDFIQ